jgi:hypothetical protein
MALLTKEEIFNADDMKTEDIEVPEWGGTVRISMMTGWARDSYEASLYNTNKGEADNFDNLRARFLSFCVVNEEGKLMFNQKDILKLGAKSAAALDRVFDAATALNSTNEEGMEATAKNS